MNTKAFFAISLACLTVFASCKKEDEDDDDTQQVTAPSNPTPTPSDADGVCVSIRSGAVTTAPIVGTYTLFTGLAVAVFPNTDGTFNNAGNVTCNGKSLSKFDNNSYAFTPSASDPTGIDFDVMNDWSVAGGGGITAFTYSNSTNIPEIGDLTVDGTVDVGADLVLGVDVNNSETTLYSPDSIYFGVYGPDAQLIVAKAGNVTSHTFTAGELGTVGTGSGYVQVAAVKFNGQTLSGQKIYFVNEGVMTKMVTFE